MIHYHGTPCGATREDVARFLTGRHALIPWVRPEDIGTAAESAYRFVEVSFQGKKKKIAIHRLVWIAANKQLTPAGFDVDHRDGPFDGIANLRLREAHDNRSRRELQETF